MFWEEGGILVLDFLILVMIFSRPLSREFVKAPAANLATIVMCSAKSSWNFLCS